MIKKESTNSIAEDIVNKMTPQIIKRVNSIINKNIIKKTLRFGSVFEFNEKVKGLSSFESVDELIKQYNPNINYFNHNNIPKKNKLIIVANHPIGAIDIFIMLQCISKVRCDVKAVVNKLAPILIPSISPLSISVDKYSNFNDRASKKIAETLENEMAVIIFPGGGISNLTLKGVRDRPWKTGVVKLAKQNKADILPVHISGRSSFIYLALPRKLRSLFVIREVFNPVKQKIKVNVGEVIPFNSLTSDMESIRFLEEETYKLRKNNISYI